MVIKVMIIVWLYNDHGGGVNGDHDLLFTVIIFYLYQNFNMDDKA